MLIPVKIKNIEVILEDETLLVVGKQVVNKENGRSDLTPVGIVLQFMIGF